MVLVLVRNLALVPLYLKYIGLEEYGAWLATGGVLSYLTIADFGLTGLLTQQAAVAYGAGDAAKLGKTVGIGLRISIALALLLGVIAASLSMFVPGFFGLTGKVATRLSICFVIASMSDSLNIFSFAAGGVLKSFQRTFVPGLLSVLSDVISIVVTVLLVTHGWGLYAIAIGLIVRGAVAAIGNSATCLWVCYRTLHLRLTCHWRDTIEFWHLSAYQFAMRIGAASLTQLDPFLIGVILGPKITAAYVLTIRAHEMVRTLAGRFADAIMPPLAHLHGEGHSSRFVEVTLMATRFQSLMAIIGMGGVLVFNCSFMKLWVGPGVYVGNATNVLMALWGASYVTFGVLWQALFARGLLSQMAKNIWLELIIKIPLMTGLLFASGVIGAPVAVVTSHVVAVISLLIVGARYMGFGIPELKGLGDTFLRIIAASGLAALVVILLFSTPHTWRAFSLQAVCYTVLALLLTALLNPGPTALMYRATSNRVLSRLSRSSNNLLSEVH